MNKSKKQYLKDFKEEQTKFERDVKTWTEEEIEEHTRNVARVYSESFNTNKLGDFSHDKDHVYYWHTLTKGADERLKARKALGYSLASYEDIKGSGLEGQTIDGETCVTMNHGNANAILLKIPRKLKELNDQIKEKARSGAYDYQGKKVKQSVSLKGNSIEVFRDEGDTG
jgi:hypothetical protein